MTAEDRGFDKPRKHGKHGHYDRALTRRASRGEGGAIRERKPCLNAHGFAFMDRVALHLAAEGRRRVNALFALRDFSVVRVRPPCCPCNPWLVEICVIRG